MTDKERVEKFKNGKFVIHCGTEEEAKEFVEWCYQNDIKWQFQDETTTYFDSCKDGIFYIYYGAKESLCFCEKSYCIDNNYKVITFKEFMNKPITNLEYILNNFNKETINETDCICETLRNCLGMQNCIDNNIESIKIHCCECKFNDQYEVLKCLNEIYKEPIKLTQFEYDIINYHGRLSKFNDICFLMAMKNKGHFKHMDSVEKCSMTIEEILENCEVNNDVER